MEAILILGFLAVICFSFIRWYKGQANKLSQEIEKVNQENNTNFSMKRHIGSRIFVDTDNRKLYFIQATGIGGVKNYNTIQSWDLENDPTSSTYKFMLNIYINNFDKPLLVIPYMTREVALKDYAKLGALSHHQKII